MTHQPLISVIIPVYNTAAYIERCIRSIQGNDYRNLEIICVNDGSTDNSLSVLQDLAAEDSRIRILDKQNGGVSAARNAALDVASGEYVAFIDSDDWIHQSYFPILARVALNSNADITIGSYMEVYSDDVSDSHIEVSFPEHVHTALASEVMSRDGYFRRSSWGRVYKRKSIGNKRFPVGVQFGEDVIFNVLVSGSAECRVSYFDVPLYFYYQIRSDSLVHIRAQDAMYTLGSWYIDNLVLFERKEVAIFSAYTALLPYRYECSLSNQKKEMRKKAQHKLNQCLKALIGLRGCPMLRKIRYFVFTVFPFAYELVLRLKYPSEFKRK